MSHKYRVNRTNLKAMVYKSRAKTAEFNDNVLNRWAISHKQLENLLNIVTNEAKPLRAINAAE